MNTTPGQPSPTPAGPPARVVWRWFRLVGLPLIAVIVIAGAIVLLRTPAEESGAAAVDLGPAEAGEETGAAPREGAPAPDFTLHATDGTTYRLSELRGRPVVLNFWATWCGPCKQEMPAFEAEYRAHAGAGLLVLAINVRESPQQVEPFVQRLELTFPVLLDRSGSVSRRYRVRALPTTVFITPEGTIDGIRQGAYSTRLLKERLRQFLEGE
jgi:cytochrome c biogenesis protein CcmG/thiol:disulfide interchange protein DsbE